MVETSASIVKLTGAFLADTLRHFKGEAIDKALVLVEKIIKAVHSRLPHGFVERNGVALSFCHELIIKPLYHLFFLARLLATRKSTFACLARSLPALYISMSSSELMLWSLAEIVALRNNK